MYPNDVEYDREKFQYEAMQEQKECEHEFIDKGRIVKCIKCGKEKIK